jgi:cytochrome c-type biogenesis protein CcmH/NrfF
MIFLGAGFLEADEPVPDRASLEERARDLEAKLMAPCCFTQTIDQHESEASREMRAEVRKWLAEGFSEEQILERYVERYGTQILAMPPAEGFNRLLYWMPYPVTVVLLVAVSLTLWIWYRRGHPE